MNIPKDEYTAIEIDEDEFIWTCNNCGAYGPDKNKIKHHKTCQAGEGKKWEKFYEEANIEEEEYNSQ